MPSKYIKKGYGEISKRAEDRLRKEIIAKCKVCETVMEFFEDNVNGNYYHCWRCLRNVILDNRITQL